MGVAPSLVHRTTPECEADNTAGTSPVSPSSSGSNEDGKGEGAASQAGYGSSSDTADRGDKGITIGGFMVIGLSLSLIHI